MGLVAREYAPQPFPSPYFCPLSKASLLYRTSLISSFSPYYPKHHQLSSCPYSLGWHLLRMERNFKPTPVIDDPRPYQVEILNLAIQKNVIVYLGTGIIQSSHIHWTRNNDHSGTGKTLIAALLIKHMLERELEYVVTKKNIEGIEVQPRLTFFLVTTVPLVFQQVISPFS